MLLPSIFAALSSITLAGWLMFRAPRAWFAGWSERGLGDINSSWVKYCLAGGGVGAAVGFYAGTQLPVYFIPALLAVAATVFTIMGLTDWRTHHAPKELSNLGLLTTAGFFAASLIFEKVGFLGVPVFGDSVKDALFQAGGWLGAMGAMYVTVALLNSQGIGGADFKALFIAGFAYAGVLGFVEAGVMTLVGIAVTAVGFIALRNAKGGKRTGLPLLPALGLSYIVGSVIYLHLLT